MGWWNWKSGAESSEPDSPARRGRRHNRDRNTSRDTRRGEGSRRSRRQRRGSPRGSVLQNSDTALQVSREQPTDGTNLESAELASDVDDVQFAPGAHSDHEGKALVPFHGHPQDEEQVSQQVESNVDRPIHRKPLPPVLQEGFLDNVSGVPHTEQHQVEDKILPPDPPFAPARLIRPETLRPKAESSRQKHSLWRTKAGTKAETLLTKLDVIHTEDHQAVHEPNSVHLRSVHDTHREDDHHAWERHLPQSADDKTIRQEVLTLFELVDQHVEGYYRDTNAEVSKDAEQHLSEIWSPYLPVPLERLLREVTYQVPIIKHCLIYLIVSGMSFEEPSMCPLLPEEFSALPRALRQSTVESGTKPYYGQAFSQFRSLCFYLRSNASKDLRYINRRNRAIDDIVSLCSTAFLPWVDGNQDADKRISNLVALFKRAADVGLKLFYQPSLFVFDWTLTAEAQASSEIALWPQMWKVTNEYGESFKVPQVMIELASQVLVLAMEQASPKKQTAPIATLVEHRPESLNHAFRSSSSDDTRKDEPLELEATFAPPRRAQTFDSPPSLTVSVPQRLPDPPPRSAARRKPQDLQQYGPNLNVLYSVTDSTSHTSHPRASTSIPRLTNDTAPSRPQITSAQFEHGDRIDYSYRGERKWVKRAIGVGTNGLNVADYDRGEVLQKISTGNS